VSGPEPDQRGSLLELSWNGATPIRLADGTERCFLNDGDEVVITASAPTSAEATGGRIHLGEVRGRIEPAR
jgi:fumarylacetoacetase